MEVALACGFVSPSHFAKCYREQYNQVPKSTRAAPQRTVDDRPARPAGAYAAE
jgi:transcriptional regulator GlxA family with amidase domain